MKNLRVFTSTVPVTLHGLSLNNGILTYVIRETKLKHFTFNIFALSSTLLRARGQASAEDEAVITCWDLLKASGAVTDEYGELAERLLAKRKRNPVSPSFYQSLIPHFFTLGLEPGSRGKAPPSLHPEAQREDPWL
jgi:hypothetical protein